jgi:hypothetical protein
MVRREIAILFLVVFCLASAAQALSAQDTQWTDRDLPERDEFHKTYELSAGARVELSGLNCGVRFETASGNTAEVHILRSARRREDLEYERIIVEHTASSLVVRGDDRDNNGRRRRNLDVRQRVIMKLPRNIDFTASGINGAINGGEIDGPVKLDGINGAVKLEQASGYAEISGINGHVVIKIAKLSNRGIDVDGVNGGVELRFTDDVNADLEVSGCNGSVHADMPNVTLFGKISRDNFRARIGSGGTRISVNGVNGRVRLTRAGAAL